MSTTVQEISNLPSKLTSFVLSITEGETSKERYEGTFEVRSVLTLGQRAEADLIEARLNEGLKEIREDTKLLNMILAQLSVRITKAPKWYIASNGGRELLDLNVLVELYKKAIEAQADWQKQVWGPIAELPKVEATDEVPANK